MTEAHDRANFTRTISHFPMRMNYMTGLLRSEVLNGHLVDVLVRHCANDKTKPGPRLGLGDRIKVHVLATATSCGGGGSSGNSGSSGQQWQQWAAVGSSRQQ